MVHQALALMFHVSADPIIDFKQVLLALKYAFYTIWVLPAYRVASAFANWRSICKLVLHPHTQSLTREPEYAIIVPARNASGTIRECLLSALKQSLPPSTLIVVDDCSCDSTASKAAEAVRDAGGSLVSARIESGVSILEYRLRGGVGETRIIVVKLRKHVGKARAVNKALRMLNRSIKYVLVLDSDTVLEKDYARKLLSLMERNEKIAGASGLPLLWKPEPCSRLGRLIAGAFREASALVYSLTVRMGECVCGCLNSIVGCAAMFRLDKLMEIGGLPEDTLADDVAVSWELALRGYKLVFSPSTLCYTVDPGSLTGMAKRMIRVSCGAQKVFFTRIKKIIRTRRWGMLATGVYSCFGSLTFVFSIMNTILTILLAHLGLLNESAMGLLARALQPSGAGVLLSFLTRHPEVLFEFAYVSCMAELALILLVLIPRFYGDIGQVVKRAKRSILYAPITPIVIWLQSIASLIALPVSLAQTVMGRGHCKW